MLTSKMCNYCDNELHCFVEELDDGSLIHVVLCPACYRVWYTVPSKQVAVSQHAVGIMSTS